MHYIRFLKPPQIIQGNLTAKIAITTDLGDDFLQVDLPLQLIMHQSTWKDRVIGDPLRKPTIVDWKAGMRELTISVPLPKEDEVNRLRNGNGGVHEWQLLVWPCVNGVENVKDPMPEALQYTKKSKSLPSGGPERAEYSSYSHLLKLSHILEINRRQSKDYLSTSGLVLAAESATFNLVGKEQKLPATIERQFYCDLWAGNEFVLVIEEETGNSIARHIWDAGVLFSSLLQELTATPTDRHAPSYLKSLHSLLRKKGQGMDVEDEISDREHCDPKIKAQKALNVLELGTGCGIVSATLSYLLPYARIIATDLEEAKEIAEKNLARNRTKDIDRIHLAPKKHLPEADSSYEVLDWTEELSGRMAEKKWDLILVADCTYNSDVVPELVRTLRHLTDKCPEVLIAVALKWRHDSEAIFHELMRENGLVVINKHTERCGNLDEEVTGREEEIEVYLFKDAKTDEKEKKVEESGKKRTLSDTVSEQPIKK